MKVANFKKTNDDDWSLLSRSLDKPFPLTFPPGTVISFSEVEIKFTQTGLLEFFISKKCDV